MAKLYALSEADYSILKQVVEAWRNGELGRPGRLPKRPASQYLSYIGMTGAGGIAAMSSAVPGSGTVTLYRFTDTGGVEAVQDDASADVTVTAYNLSDEDVAGSAYVQLKTEAITGRYLVDFEQC